MSYRIATYNIENMRNLFKKGALTSESRDRAAAIARVIKANAPDILGIVEADDNPKNHKLFLDSQGLFDMGYRFVKSVHKRSRQDLLFYYRRPFEPISVDEQIDFYKQWTEDIDADGIEEVCKFERKPLEVRFINSESNVELLIILIAVKSKGVFSVSDLVTHQHLALANRKRQYAQAKKIRERLDRLIDTEPNLPVVVLGDFNDEPGLDSVERLLGVSALETMMGSVFEPERIFHNALSHMCKKPALKKDLWTTEYPDLIVQNLQKHKGWLDHILASPNMLRPECAARIVPASGRVAEKNTDARAASDHYMVFCDIEM